MTPSLIMSDKQLMKNDDPTVSYISTSLLVLYNTVVHNHTRVHRQLKPVCP